MARSTGIPPALFAAQAKRMIGLAIQQNLSSLPPTPAQAIVYEFDPELSTFLASNQLEPVAFHSARTIAKGQLNFRLAASYLELEEFFGPINGAATVAGSSDPATIYQIGLDAKTKVGVVTLTAGYGLLDRLQLAFNLPIVVVDAEGDLLFSTEAGAVTEPLSDTTVGGAPSPSLLNEGIADGSLAVRRGGLDSLAPGFPSGTEAGIGRISIGAKALGFTAKWVDIAPLAEFFFPSPNEDELAGSDSPALLGLLIGAVPLHRYLRLYTSAGYEYDFDVAELRRFLWTAGVSLPFEHLTLDLGAGGSVFDVPGRWSPNRVVVPAGGSSPAITAVPLGNNKIGDEPIDFLLGVKAKISDRWNLGGTVVVPVSEQGYRPYAAGTISIEGHF
jgi:hypothetical protein